MPPVHAKLFTHFVFIAIFAQHGTQQFAIPLGEPVEDLAYLGCALTTQKFAFKVIGWICWLNRIYACLFTVPDIEAMNLVQDIVADPIYIRT